MDQVLRAFEVDGNDMFEPVKEVIVLSIRKNNRNVIGGCDRNNCSCEPEDVQKVAEEFITGLIKVADCRRQMCNYTLQQFLTHQDFRLNFNWLEIGERDDDGHEASVQRPAADGASGAPLPTEVADEEMGEGEPGTITIGSTDGIETSATGAGDGAAVDRRSSGESDSRPKLIYSAFCARTMKSSALKQKETEPCRPEDTEGHDDQIGPTGESLITNEGPQNLGEISTDTDGLSEVSTPPMQPEVDLDTVWVDASTSDVIFDNNAASSDPHHLSEISNSSSEQSTGNGTTDITQAPESMDTVPPSESSTAMFENLPSSVTEPAVTSSETRVSQSAVTMTLSPETMKSVETIPLASTEMIPPTSSEANLPTASDAIAIPSTSLESTVGERPETTSTSETAAPTTDERSPATSSELAAATTDEQAALTTSEHAPATTSGQVPPNTSEVAPSSIAELKPDPAEAELYFTSLFLTGDCARLSAFVKRVKTVSSSKKPLDHVLEVRDENMDTNSDDEELVYDSTLEDNRTIDETTRQVVSDPPNDSSDKDANDSTKEATEESNQQLNEAAPETAANADEGGIQQAPTAKTATDPNLQSKIVSRYRTGAPGPASVKKKREAKKNGVSEKDTEDRSKRNRSPESSGLQDSPQGSSSQSTRKKPKTNDFNSDPSADQSLGLGNTAEESKQDSPQPSASKSNQQDVHEISTESSCSDSDESQYSEFSTVSHVPLQKRLEKRKKKKAQKKLSSIMLHAMELNKLTSKGRESLVPSVPKGDSNSKTPKLWISEAIETLEKLKGKEKQPSSSSNQGQMTKQSSTASIKISLTKSTQGDPLQAKKLTSSDNNKRPQDAASELDDENGWRGSHLPATREGQRISQGLLSPPTAAAVQPPSQVSSSAAAQNSGQSESSSAKVNKRGSSSSELETSTRARLAQQISFDPKNDAIALKPKPVPVVSRERIHDKLVGKGKEKEPPSAEISLGEDSDIEEVPVTTSADKNSSRKQSTAQSKRDDRERGQGPSSERQSSGAPASAKRANMEPKGRQEVNSSGRNARDSASKPTAYQDTSTGEIRLIPKKSSADTSSNNSDKRSTGMWVRGASEADTSHRSDRPPNRGRTRSPGSGGRGSGGSQPWNPQPRNPNATGQQRGPPGPRNNGGPSQSRFPNPRYPRYR